MPTVVGLRHFAIDCWDFRLNRCCFELGIFLFASFKVDRQWIFEGKSYLALVYGLIEGCWPDGFGSDLAYCRLLVDPRLRLTMLRVSQSMLINLFYFGQADSFLAFGFDLIVGLFVYYLN